jgi:general secretion pathway protein A
MYEEFFGFKEDPFRATPDPEYLFLGVHHREALARMIYGIQERKGFILITGEVGTGKTLLIRHLLRNLVASQNGVIRTALVFNPKMGVVDFLRHILSDLGVLIRDRSKGDYLRDLNGFLLQAFEKGEKVVLIVDEAQGLKPAMLEEIRLLSNLETAKSKLLQIILVGQPELKKIVDRPDFRQLRQRINLRFHIPPLTEEETRAYIQKRVTVAGGEESLFTAEAIHEVFLRSRGIPRLINMLCDNALLDGFAAEQKFIDADLVKNAGNDLELK